MLALVSALTSMDEKVAECEKEVEELKKKLNELMEDTSTNALREYTEEKESAMDSKPSEQSYYKLTCEKRLLGHFSGITDMQWSPDSQRMLSCSRDGKLRLWKVSTGKTIVAVPLRSVQPLTCSLGADGNLAASGGLDNLVSLFEVGDDSRIGWEVTKPLCELQKHEGCITKVRFPAANRIVSASADATCILWDVEKQTDLETYTEHTSDVLCLDVLRSHELMVTASSDCTVKIWDLRSEPQAIASFSSHKIDVNCCRWFADGAAVVSGDDDSYVRLFDIRSMRQLNEFKEEGCDEPVYSVAVTKSGGRLFAAHGNGDQCGVAWNTLTAETDDCWKPTVPCMHLEMAPDSQCLAGACIDRTIRIWN